MPDTDIAERMRQLARLPDTPHPFVSLYLDTKWDDPTKREAARIFLKNKVREASNLYDFAPGERAGFDRDIARIQGLLDSGLDRAAQGLAIFACAGEGVFESIQAPRQFTNQFLVATRPLLRQIARFVDEYEPVVVVAVDTRSARVFEIVVGGVVSEVDIENEVSKRIEVGGWSQMTYQRRVHEEMSHHHKEVADQVARVVDRGAFQRVILFGQQNILGNLKRYLPKRVLEKVISEDNLNPNEAKDKVLRRALELLKEEEERADDEILHRVKDQTLSGGLGVMGVEDTLEALRMGNVHTLVVDAEFSVHGFRCDRCNSLHAQPAEGEREAFRCRFCNGELDRVEMDESMLQEAIAQGAQIIHLDRVDPDLAKMGHVGALLRYRE